nr:MAG TPA: hypothetical protein [Caudoviricetes sp.]DAN54175.1 MAG TPA: hypothetical protein [Caudoviricetes sp.]
MSVTSIHIVKNFAGSSRKFYCCFKNFSDRDIVS